ncbi:integrase core domain containing protein [Nitzschia inconspicua]|uniref:Integrase core domain containing protein n=1 Tax=Nitzschia inconspicua TaxID=303405 RepID=A0A9K3KCI1_9STRA|nr:integrase core domain containing protein [Nitzschia inconspicua]
MNRKAYLKLALSCDDAVSHQLIKKSDKGKTKFQGECHHCGKKGHKKADCFKLKEAKADESGAVVLMAEDIAEEMDEEFSGWTNDPNEEQLMCQLIHEPDVEEFHEISLIQDRPILIIPNDDDSTGEPIVIGREIAYTDEEMNEWCTVPETEEQEVDEVCLTTGLKNRIDDNLMIGDSGATVHMRRDTSGMYDLREEKCIIKYGNGAQSTSTIVETANGFLLAARFEPMELQNESAHVGLKEGTNVQIMKFHTMMGHANEDSIRLTAKHMGVILTGKMMKCEPCAIGKLKQMSVPKVASREVTKPGEVLYMDTASIDKPSMGSKKFWFLFVDGFSDHTISCFGKHKSDLMRVGIDMLLDLKKKDIVVKTIRCDNAGENKMLEQACRKQGLQIVFEYTAPGTPQQNGVVERKFATLFGKVRSMNNGAGLHDTIRQQLWAEAANCATDLECLLVKKMGDRTPYELFYGKVAPYGPYLRTFGEIGVARNIATVKGKLDDRGSPAIFLGYAKQHAGNVYRMLDLKTRQLRLSRDVQWLSKTYGEYKNPQIREDAQDDDHDSQLGIGEDDHDVQDNSEVENQDEENTQDDGWQEFVIDTKDRGVLIKPDKKQGVFAYCDSDFAGDLGNRRSITGFLIYLFGVPISWKSKQQGGVTLSSSEAEYYAISEVSMELKFVKMVMDFLDIEPGGTMKVFVDNLGAIHLANNASSGSRTKHIDTRLHFVRELTQGEDKLIDIEFVRSEENQSDTFTKNTSNDTFWRLTSKYMVGD